jgi:group II intron reverse transcriptase/maturase
MSLETPDKTRTLQRKLYRKAKEEPDYRFYLLYDKIYREDILYYAYELVKFNRGAVGADGQTFAGIESQGLGKWLAEIREEFRTKRYKPQPVRRVMIPKPGGGERPLGIPTIRDRVVQTAAKLVLEPIFEADLEPCAYGYRPKRSAQDAIRKVHELLCAGYTEVVDADLSKYFDTIPHRQLMPSVARRIVDREVLRLLKAWLKAPVEERDEKGNRHMTGGKGSTRGTPQGGVVSPILANLFMHYTFDLWMARTHPDFPWCRYADDGLVHCRTEQEAEALKAKLQARLAECHLEMHPTKTKVVYCKDGKRKDQYPTVKFDFLGYCFRPRLVRRFRDNSLFCGFNPAVSPSAMKAMREAIRDLNIWHQTQLSLQDIAQQLNPLLRGWIEYYGRYAPSALYPLLRYVNQTLLAWVMRKFKRFKGHKIQASQFLQRLATERVGLFVHWQIGMSGTFA